MIIMGTLICGQSDSGGGAFFWLFHTISTFFKLGAFETPKQRFFHSTQYQIYLL